MYTPELDPDHPREEQTQTDIEKAKLARRRAEYAILKDALRRGIPAFQIPFLVAAASGAHHTHTQASGGYAYGVYPHLPGGYGFGYGYRVPVPISQSPAPTSQSLQRQRQNDHDHRLTQTLHRRRQTAVLLDDSFLRRAYKRRSWSSGVRAGLGEAKSGSAGQVYFHHWVPGG